MSTCQDNYFTTFPDFPAMLRYHEEQNKHSQWERCQVKSPLGRAKISGSVLTKLKRDTLAHIINPLIKS